MGSARKINNFNESSSSIYIELLIVTLKSNKPPQQTPSARAQKTHHTNRIGFFVWNSDEDETPD